MVQTGERLLYKFSDNRFIYTRSQLYNVCFLYFMHNIILLKGTMRRRKIRKSSGVGRRMNPASKRIRQVSPRSLRRIQKRFFWFSLYLWVPRAKLKRFRSKSGLFPVFFRNHSGMGPESCLGMATFFVWVVENI